MISNATKRFSGRVENYRKFRPSYPVEVFDVLRERCEFKQSEVADVGSGTGIFSQLLLGHGAARVYGVEPNAEMRGAAETMLASQGRFVSIDATAEATTLPDASVELVTAAQAFHWFDPERTRVEFRRILRPGGHVALIWNDRQLESTPFLRAYEALLVRFGTDYAAVRRKDLDLTRARSFVGSDDVTQTVLVNGQLLDYPALEGRLLSSSYVPAAGHPEHLRMLAELRVIFERDAVADQVAFIYDTRVFCARLT